ncbi:hydroxyisourate hydrolase [Aciduricibacillus chroicocephali]|uniref:hydroxyisourate hydrolase n=1 Tax=Aciduricibacillus chroicocephali TaxID=3054939 RepID=A0ABY9KWR7_9BACI|nr:hydroxyisourate hydrolase [Bacillaceae bacterium 44XB]
MKKSWIGVIGFVLIAVVAFLSFEMGTNSMKSAESKKTSEEKTEQQSKMDKKSGSGQMQGGLSTHVLDQAQGKPAEGIPVTLYKVDHSGKKTKINKAKTAEDGRVKELLAPSKVKEGDYEIVFSVGKYFKKSGAKTEFLNEIPVRFHVEDASKHYHVPIVAAPGGYSTYHGS